MLIRMDCYVYMHDISPHLSVTLVQLMRPGIGIGQNASSAADDFVQHLGLVREMCLVPA